MKQIVVLSGKGGTGKTVVTGALSAIVPDKVMVDCDVDAADLHLLLKPRILETNDFQAGKKALIDPRLCVRCGRCLEACRFDAVTQHLTVDPSSCEGCGLCARICPAGAITMQDTVCGQWFVSETRFGPMVHARLGIGEENSGKLVAQVRQKARDLAVEGGKNWVIIDGPPGVGCPVMASLSGVNAVLLVTEPTCSGLHDAGRVIDLGKHFRIPLMLVVNKWDINPSITEQIEDFCVKNGVHLGGRLPFDPRVVEAVVQGRTIMESDALAVREQMLVVWEKLKGIV